jgi:1-acyl-sn-glycerol-3-phosphate acyltransferase
MELVYRPVIGFALAVFKGMGWKIDVRGTEHIPASGGAVIATNHVGYLDFTFIGYGALERGRLVRFLAKKEAFDHRITGPLLRGMKHIPVDRYGRAAESVTDALAALRDGELIGMFPEGTISRSFVPRAGKTGAARMAMAAGAPLIPSAVWGSQRILTKGRPRNIERGVAISVAFDAPIPYEPEDDPGEVTKRLMEKVSDLVESLWATYPQQPAGPHDAWWLPAHLGGTAPTIEEAEELAARERAERRAQARAESRRRRGLAGPAG